MGMIIMKNFLFILCFFINSSKTIDFKKLHVSKFFSDIKTATPSFSSLSIQKGIWFSVALFIPLKLFFNIKKMVEKNNALRKACKSFFTENLLSTPLPNESPSEKVPDTSISQSSNRTSPDLKVQHDPTFSPLSTEEIDSLIAHLTTFILNRVKDSFYFTVAEGAQSCTNKGIKQDYSYKCVLKKKQGKEIQVIFKEKNIFSKEEEPKEFKEKHRLLLKETQNINNFKAEHALTTLKRLKQALSEEGFYYIVNEIINKSSEIESTNFEKIKTSTPQTIPAKAFQRGQQKEMSLPETTEEEYSSLKNSLSKLNTNLSKEKEKEKLSIDKEKVKSIFENSPFIIEEVEKQQLPDKLSLSSIKTLNIFFSHPLENKIFQTILQSLVLPGIYFVFCKFYLKK